MRSISVVCALNWPARGVHPMPSGSRVGQTISNHVTLFLMLHSSGSMRLSLPCIRSPLRVRLPPPFQINHTGRLRLAHHPVHLLARTMANFNAVVRLMKTPIFRRENISSEVELLEQFQAETGVHPNFVQLQRVVGRCGCEVASTPGIPTVVFDLKLVHTKLRHGKPSKRTEALYELGLEYFQTHRDLHDGMDLDPQDFGGCEELNQHGWAAVWWQVTRMMSRTMETEMVAVPPATGRSAAVTPAAAPATEPAPLPAAAPAPATAAAPADAEANQAGTLDAPKACLHGRLKMMSDSRFVELERAVEFERMRRTRCARFQEAERERSPRRASGANSSSAGSATRYQ